MKSTRAMHRMPVRKLTRRKHAIRGHTPGVTSSTASTFACFNILIKPRRLHSMVDARMYVTPKALT